MALILSTSQISEGRQVGVPIIGEEEIVFDWTTDRCDMQDIPDLPARAFRDIFGQIQLIATHNINRRMIGNSLENVERDCTVIMESGRESAPELFDGWEWISSTYTLDGHKIYALIHNEFQGLQAGHWRSVEDFSSTQGQSGWHYQEWIGGYSNMFYDPNNNRWQGSRATCVLGNAYAHPEGFCEPARKWVSPVSATVKIRGDAKDLDGGGGDGVILRIVKGTEELWSQVINNGDTKTYSYNLDVDVERGDAIYFRVNQRNSSNFDSTQFTADISIEPDLCSSGQTLNCWYNSISLAISNDGGRSYQHSEAPTHLIAAPPYQYVPDSGAWGYFAPSNIIHNPNDDYYYTFIAGGPYRSQQWAACLMRTKDLDDPLSWRAWDGESFDVQFINPYLESDFKPFEHVCRPVDRDDIGWIKSSLTYNTYFEQFLLVGEFVKAGQQGFYYALSDDLIEWTEMELLMDVNLTTQETHCNQESLLYPSLIDPTDTSMNFEVTGKQPYLYFTRFHPCTSTNFRLDRDLVRIQIEFK
jgi:hypothetical protein